MISSADKVFEMEVVVVVVDEEEEEEFDNENEDGDEYEIVFLPTSPFWLSRPRVKEEKEQPETKEKEWKGSKLFNFKLDLDLSPNRSYCNKEDVLLSFVFLSRRKGKFFWV